MAVKQMTEIADRIMVQRNLVKCYLVHRTGHVLVGHPSILIATSSPHRHESHSAVMDILNEVKSKVPVWKKVIYSVGNTESAVRNGDHCHWSDKSEAFWLNKWLCHAMAVKIYIYSKSVGVIVYGQRRSKYQNLEQLNEKNFLQDLSRRNLMNLVL